MASTTGPGSIDAWCPSTSDRLFAGAWFPSVALTRPAGVAPKHDAIDEIDRIYLEPASGVRRSPANVGNLRRIARDPCSRSRRGHVLAGTDLSVIFDEAAAGFPAVDCAAGRIDAILDRV